MSKIQETVKRLAIMVAESCNWRVIWFATEMQKVLHENRGKSGWEEMTDKQILRRIRQETKELTDAVENNESDERKISEAVDIANFCMFFAARYSEKMEITP